jgi:hypothetical protein
VAWISHDDNKNKRQSIGVINESYDKWLHGIRYFVIFLVRWHIVYWQCGDFSVLLETSLGENNVTSRHETPLPFYHLRPFAASVFLQQRHHSLDERRVKRVLSLVVGVWSFATHSTISRSPRKDWRQTAVWGWLRSCLSLNGSRYCWKTGRRCWRKDDISWLSQKHSCRQSTCQVGASASLKILCRPWDASFCVSTSTTTSLTFQSSRFECGMISCCRRTSCWGLLDVRVDAFWLAWIQGDCCCK